MGKTIKLVKSENFVERKLGEETVLVPITQLGVDVQSIYTLNTTASAIWNLLENVSTEEGIVRAIEKEYRSENGKIRHDVNNVLSDFIQEKFILVVKE